MRKSTRPLFGAIAIALALGVSGPAEAQSDDPHIDPDSPAGTEYELPLDRAREEAGGGAAGGGSSGEAPLFGEGVESERSGSTGSDSSGSADETDASKKSAERDDADSGSGAATPATVRAQAPSPDGGGNSLLAIAAGAGGVLLFGGLAGLAWRRRLSSQGVSARPRE